MRGEKKTTTPATQQKENGPVVRHLLDYIVGWHPIASTMHVHLLPLKFGMHLELQRTSFQWMFGLNHNFIPFLIVKNWFNIQLIANHLFLAMDGCFRFQVCECYSGSTVAGSMIFSTKGHTSSPAENPQTYQQLSGRNQTP